MAWLGVASLSMVIMISYVGEEETKLQERYSIFWNNDVEEQSKSKQNANEPNHTNLVISTINGSQFSTKAKNMTEYPVKGSVVPVVAEKQ